VGIGDTDPSEAKLSIDNVASGDAGLKIKQAQAQNGLLIDQNGNSHAIYIDSAASTGDGIRVEASSLTTSSAAHFYSGGANTSTRNLVHIHNDHASATGTTALYVKQDSTGLAADFIGAGGIRSASGIKFGTDTAAANALDDYEEGNFTTTFIVGGNAITASYTAQHVASYIKVGKMVTCFIQTNTSSISGTISGNVELTGLPFTKGGNGSAGSHCGDAYHFANNHPMAYTVYSDKIGLNRPDANKTAIVAADLRTSGDSNQLFLSFSYRTA
jgi:hypothetical protein